MKVTQHNITPSAVEHGCKGEKHACPSVTSASHNYYSGMLARNVTSIPSGRVRTGVRIVDDARQRLRQHGVQPALRRGQPLDATVNRAPLLLEGCFGLWWHIAQVERPTSPEVDARIRHTASIAGEST